MAWTRVAVQNAEEWMPILQKGDDASAEGTGGRTEAQQTFSGIDAGG
jgi:hypothetical protein